MSSGPLGFGLPVSILRRGLETEGWSGPLTSAWTSVGLFTAAISVTAVVSGQLFWRAANISFQENSPIPTFVSPSIHAGVLKRWVEKSAKMSPWVAPQNPLKSLVSLAGWKKRRSFLCWTSKPMALKWDYMLLCQIDPFLYMAFFYFDSCSKIKYQ